MIKRFIKLIIFFIWFISLMFGGVIILYILFNKNSFEAFEDCLSYMNKD